MILFVIQILVDALTMFDPNFWEFPYENGHSEVRLQPYFIICSGTKNGTKNHTSTSFSHQIHMYEASTASTFRGCVPHLLQKCPRCQFGTPQWVGDGANSGVFLPGEDRLQIGNLSRVEFYISVYTTFTFTAAAFSGCWISNFRLWHDFCRR